jgi:glyoxylase I family protein
VEGAGPDYSGFRHLAFLVSDLDEKLADMGDEARITLGPLDMSQFIPGMRVAWIADPEGNIVELNQGYVDEDDPPALPE